MITDMKGLTLVGIAVTLYAINSGITANGFNVPALAWYPVAALLGALLISLWMARSGSLRDLWPVEKKARWLLLGGGIAMTMNNGLFMTSLQKTSVAVALLTHYLTPLLVAVLFAPLFLKEKLTRRDLLITLIGLAGLTIVLWPELSHAQLGLGALLGILSAFFFAYGIILSRQLSHYKVGGLTTAMYQNIVPALLMSPFFFQSFSAGQFESGDWSRILIFGILSLGIGFTLFTTGLQKTDKAAHAAVISYGEPIGAIILATLFLGEPLTLYVIVGAILLVGAGVALVLGQDKK
jgi:drug/metabolite transporter (DMT)-like permease